MLQSDPVASQASAPVRSPIGHFRWLICGLLFYATTVNYMDRVALSILQTTIARDLHWTNSDYGLITSAFQLGYGLMLPLAGRAIDWIGLRIGYGLAALIWALFSMAHSLAGNAFQFAIMRLGLGVGEAANFPAAIKAVADWFPQKERALATGIFNAGTNVGALIGPIVVPLAAVHYGWRAGFLVTSAFSLSWILFWWFLYREPEEHPRLSKNELAYIRADSANETPSGKTPYTQLLRRRAAWAFLLGKFMTDPVWWFYLFWIPGFLDRKYGVDLKNIGPPLVTIYLLADIGSVAGGWLSSQLLRRGWELTRARKMTMLLFAFCTLAVWFVPMAHGNLWLTVTLLGLAAGAHQGWSANLFTMSSDNFPRSTVGSVVGLGGLGGAAGGFLVQIGVGKWLDFSHESYAPLFIAAGSMYLLCLLAIHLLVPKFGQSNAALYNEP